MPLYPPISIPVDIQVYTSGSGTWSRPTTGNLVEIICIGGGGGGGAGFTAFIGGSGGAGGRGELWVMEEI